MYFWITNSDGDVHVRVLTKDQVLADIQERVDNDMEPEKFKTLDDLKKDSSMDYGGPVLIKGEVVVPHVKTTVTEYDVP